MKVRMDLLLLLLLLLLLVLVVVLAAVRVLVRVRVGLGLGLVRVRVRVRVRVTCSSYKEPRALRAVARDAREPPPPKLGWRGAGVSEVRLPPRGVWPGVCVRRFSVSSN